MELPLSPEECLEALLAHIWPRTDLDTVAFTEGNITYHQLQRIDQLANPQFYTEASQLEDADYQAPHFQDVQSEGEEDEERGRGGMPPAHTRPVGNPFGDPTFRAQLSRAILGEIERITG